MGGFSLKITTLYSTENHHKITNSHNLCPFLDVYLHINKLKKKETGILLVGKLKAQDGEAKVTARVDLG